MKLRSLGTISLVLALACDGDDGSAETENGGGQSDTEASGDSNASAGSSMPTDPTAPTGSSNSTSGPGTSGTATTDPTRATDETATETASTDPTAGTDSSSTDATGASSSDGDGSSSGGVPQPPPPTGAAVLIPWLEAGNYLDWHAESGPHDSDGPHFGDVRTYMNDALFDALEAGSTDHPVDAAAVKELYGSGATVRGWAVMVKTDPGATGQSWYWMEVFDGTTYSDANGDGQCTNCHGMGTDFVRSDFPLQ